MSPASPPSMAQGIRSFKLLEGVQDHQEYNKNTCFEASEMYNPGSTASVADLFFFFDDVKTKSLFFNGCFFSILTGLVRPILAHLLSKSFSSLVGASIDVSQINTIGIYMVSLGIYSFIVGTIQTACLDTAAHYAAVDFRKKWFSSLLRQDAAFFDSQNASDLASIFEATADTYQRGLGRNFGECIEKLSSIVGGIAYAFHSSWRMAIVIAGVLPFFALKIWFLIKIQKRPFTKAAIANRYAGGVAFSTMSAIQTILSVNAVSEMIFRYQEATKEAYRSATSRLWRRSSLKASIVGTSLLLFCIISLCGISLLHRDMERTGCYQSVASGVPGVFCTESPGPSIYGATASLVFVIVDIMRISEVIQRVTSSRSACDIAMKPIRRIVGVPAVKDEGKLNDQKDLERGIANEKKKSEVDQLAGYHIDSSSPLGLRPPNITGEITFDNVNFAYPTRPDKTIFEGFDLKIEAGTTVALVGPSGGGKSTIASLIERFYDPRAGKVLLDGIDLKLMNVHYLRSQIGYIGQEPKLFAMSIADNIRCGKLTATVVEVETAAKIAKAHDFILSLKEGYDTQVGDEGSLLSGGQKQRIAIARVLIARPKVFILDEATSALDAESELAVQEAIDSLIRKEKRTAIVIAHRLATIRNADKIAVIRKGTVVEAGSHTDLMACSTSYYRELINKNESEQSFIRCQRSLAGRQSFIDMDQKDGGTRCSMYSTHHVKFRNLTFSYPTLPKTLVMKGFNLSIRKGETLALVGPSGGGKSTVLSLLERFHDPIHGIIEYEGEDIQELNVAWLRDQIGLVRQEPILFNTSVAKNIAIGCPQAKDSDIVEASKMANCHDFIEAFSRGYETEVGENGSLLSGGQKQRIAIARALIRRPKLLLLDEATSALDTDSERTVQASLDAITASRDITTIVIAHRLATIRKSDRIAFVSNGKVRELGTHEELMAKPCGRYRKLVEYEKRSSTMNIQTIMNKSFSPRKKYNKAEKEDRDGRLTEQIDKSGIEDLDLTMVFKLVKHEIKPVFFGVSFTMLSAARHPCFGFLFAKTLNLLFVQVDSCPVQDGTISLGFSNCDDFMKHQLHDMKESLFRLGGYWLALPIFAFVIEALRQRFCTIASERLNKRVRDATFQSLIRQEVAFFDRHAGSGKFALQLQNDAAKIHYFFGDSIPLIVEDVTAFVIGFFLSLTYMWPFALMSLGSLPILFLLIKKENSIATQQDNNEDTISSLSPSGIVVETLVNLRTVSSLTIERQRYKDYCSALQRIHFRRRIIESAVSGNIMSLVGKLVLGLQLWWGGWLLIRYPNQYSFVSFQIALQVYHISFTCLTEAWSKLSNNSKDCVEAGKRLFYLLGRKSLNDPLSNVRSSKCKSKSRSGT